MYAPSVGHGLMPLATTGSQSRQPNNEPPTSIVTSFDSLTTANVIRPQHGQFQVAEGGPTLTPPISVHNVSGR